VTGLIDWPRALRCAHAAVFAPDRTRQAVETVLATAPVFRNREFPLSPVPVFVRQGTADLLRAPLAEYVRLLGKAVALYREHPEVRRFYGSDPPAERLIEADTALGDVPWVCRLDGYLEYGTERLRLLENNADSPAGTLFTARINDTVAEIASALSGVDTGQSVLTYTGEHRFLEALRAAAVSAAKRDPGRCADPSSIAVLQPAGSPNRESIELVTQFRAAGVDAFLADPAEVSVRGGRTRFAGRAADLCWNKVNTVAWRRYCADGDFVDRWVAAVRDSSLVHVNPFGARYVGENKLTLALLQQPEFAELFTADDAALAAELLPWTRKLTQDATTDDGSPLVCRLFEDPREFVLKQHYDIRGDGVTIGFDCPPSQWREAVATAASHGHIVQRRVTPTQYPVVEAGANLVQTMSISMDTYMVGGEVAGFGAKASRNAKVNIFQGGRKLAVHVVGEVGHEDCRQVG
jgi:hypothetical protein